MGKYKTVAGNLLKVILVALVGIVYQAMEGASRADQSPTTAQAQAEPSKQAILKSIARGVNYLLAQKTANFWEVVPPGAEYSGGPTALAVYALLEAGQTTGDPRLQPDSPDMAPAINYLLQLKPQSTYVASLQISALTVVPNNQPEFMNAIIRAEVYLLNSQHADGAYHYQWDGIKKNENLPGDWDNSNSQYGVLGIWAAEMSGLDVPFNYWFYCDKHWRSTQNPDGGWSYAQSGSSSQAMTAAGLASLFIIDQYQQDGIVQNPREDQNIQNGLTWLGQNIQTQSDMYYLYGLERVGLASGWDKIGGVDWYQMGVNTILANQDAKSGGWQGTVLAQPTPVVPTSYALLFLVRGLNPVIFEKLAYSGSWDNRPLDDANLSRWMGQMFEEPLNWRSVDTQMSLENWLNAPVLLITGRDDPHFSQADIARLRDYLAHGGLIFSVADGGSKEFTAAMQKAAAAVTDGRLQLAVLEPNNPIYTVQYHLPASLGLMGLSNGIHMNWIHSPGDLNTAWQNMDVENNLTAFQTAANVYFYATGKHRISLDFTLDSDAISVSVGPPVRSINIALIRHAGVWNPEPDGLVQFVKLARETYHTQLTFTVEDIDDLDVNKTPVAYMIGMDKVDLSWQTEHNLRNFLNNGGTLITEAAGSNPDFSDSFNTIAAELYPLAYLEPVSLDSSIFNGSTPGSVALKQIEFREYHNIVHGYSSNPGLLGLKRDNRMMIVVNPYDISSALVNAQVWGIDGYAPGSAQKMLMDEILYAAANTSAVQATAAKAHQVTGPLSYTAAEQQ
jgi:Domain of unknown function (DUF4159)